MSTYNKYFLDQVRLKPVWTATDFLDSKKLRCSQDNCYIQALKSMTQILLVRADYSVSVVFVYMGLSYDIGSGSEITPCNKNR